MWVDGFVAHVYVRACVCVYVPYVTLLDFVFSDLVKKCLEGLPTRLHASDFLSKKLRRPTVYYPLSSKLVLEEHDRILQYEKEARIHWVDTCISTLKAQNKPVPLRLQTEHNALSLIELQKRVRAEVVGTMPEDALNGRNFRNKKVLCTFDFFVPAVSINVFQRVLVLIMKFAFFRRSQNNKKLAKNRRPNKKLKPRRRRRSSARIS